MKRTAPDIMTTWLTALDTLSAQATPAILVTIAGAEGSAPREPGAKMLVTATAQFDTIGGGHLEMRAVEIAREMLEMPAASQLPAERRIARFALGPSLGQCCGGVVHLAFERIDSEKTWACYRSLYTHWRDRKDCWRIVAMDTVLPPMLANRAGSSMSGTEHVFPAHFDRDRPCHLTADQDDCKWLVDPCFADRHHLVLFGAGHVGAALVHALAALPCHVTWVDEREDMFPSDAPLNVGIEITDTPEAVIEEAPAGSSFLVMTHSHALDLRLSEAILRRADTGWFGLIGSHTKRMQFERRLLERGISAERLSHMVCPIGLPGISGKAPPVIAASVCAQLLLAWEKADEI